MLQKLAPLTLLLALIPSSTLAADTADSFERNDALRVSQQAIGGKVADVSFSSQSGKVVSLRDYEGKPLVISLIYTSCYHICPTTTQHLHRVVKKARAVLGTDTFNVITVGFDTFRDTPEMMSFYADRQQIATANWRFLAADSESIDLLTESLGFLYYETPNGFDHLIQTSLLDREGKVYRQIYGLDFETPKLVEPLKQLILGEPTESLLEAFTNQITLFCTVYDPAQDKYRFDYSLFVGAFIGFLCVGLLGFQLLREWRTTLRQG